jgi:hypothetical protein
MDGVQLFGEMSVDQASAIYATWICADEAVPVYDVLCGEPFCDSSSAFSRANNGVEVLRAMVVQNVAASHHAVPEAKGGNREFDRQSEGRVGGRARAGKELESVLLYSL